MRFPRRRLGVTVQGDILQNAPGFTGVNPARPSPTLPIRRPKAGKRGQGAHLLLSAAFLLSGPPERLRLGDRRRLGLVVSARLDRAPLGDRYPKEAGLCGLSSTA